MDRVCNICGSKLIEINKTTTRSDQTFPIISTSYKCSNQTCQDAIDARVAEALQKKQERELIRENKKKALLKA